MTIEIRFEPGDTVYLMASNTVQKAEVLECYITVRVDSNLNIQKDISYKIKFVGFSKELQGYNDHALFATKEELLKSL